MPARSAAALGAPLETVTGPVEEVVTQVTTALPPAVPTRPPAQVNLPTPPVETPTASDKPSPTPAEPPVSPPSADVPIVKTPSAARSSPPIDPPPGPSRAPAAEGLTSGTAEAVGETAQAAGIDPGSEAVGQLEGDNRLAAGATGASGSTAVLRAPLVAPLRQLLVYVWPAVSLGHPGLANFLDRAERGVVSLIAVSRAGSGLAAGVALRRESAPRHGIGVADWLNPRLFALSNRFVPDPPLPLVALYLILAAGFAAIWCISRREVGLRTLSRRRRI